MQDNASKEALAGCEDSHDALMPVTHCHVTMRKPEMLLTAAELPRAWFTTERSEQIRNSP